MSPRFLVLAGALLATSQCFASLMTFDDIFIPPGFNSYVPIADGYQSFNWNNFGAFYGPGTPMSGYDAGVVSSPNVAFNFGGNAASFSSTTPFTFGSAYFTAAWMDGLNITIQGLNGSTVVDATTIVVNATTPMLATFGWADLTEVDFTASGGTQHPGYNGIGSQFAMDNVTIDATPEPATVLLVGLSGLALLWSKRRSALRR